VIDAFGHPQSVVVLGGTSDIAGALVEVLAADRCRTVVLAGRDVPRLDAAAARALASGARIARTVVFDAAQPEQAGAVVERCAAAAGDSIDLVVVAVGLLGFQQRDVGDPGRVSEMITSNFTWPAAAVGAMADHLRAQGRGRIVVLSSVAGVRMRPANFLYGSAKRGLDAFVLALGDELDGSGVSLHVVRPGFVHSKMTSGRRPAPFAVAPAAVASAIQRGIERDQRVIWVPSVLRWVTFGMRLLPRPVWRRLRG
jgi:decaprenylphospho-beta-D-erythro-pentofuranosid-2-ulose 2-reductase